MHRPGIFLILTSGVQLAGSQFSSLLSWSEVIVVGVNYTLALMRKRQSSSACHLGPPNCYYDSRFS